MTEDNLDKALNSAQNWVEAHKYQGYEPFDGLSSWARRFAFGNQFTERLLMQLIRQSPFNLRPLMGIHPQDSTKGRGYMANGYLYRYRATGNKEYLEKAVHCLEWLDRHKVKRFQYHSWSNHFDFVARGGGYTKDDPIIVWTALIGHAYVEAFEATQEDWFLRVAESVCNWIMQLPREKSPKGECISYLSHLQSSIHNSNMLGASILARTAKHTGNPEFLRVARSAMEYSCSRQNPDGSWWYAEEPKYHWIDNFHTGYNLDSLKHYSEAAGDFEFGQNLQRGLEFFKRNFFEENGRPKYYHTRAYPVDIQCAAQAIDTLALFADSDSECLELAGKVADWTIQNMQDPTGYFYYRQYPFVKAKTPMLHWGQATMYKALSRLSMQLNSRAKSRPRPAVAAQTNVSAR
jgi:rhamnogalacturonyl hydrolase YesR